MLERLTVLPLVFALSGCATPYGSFLAGRSVYGISQDTVVTAAEALELRRESHYVTNLPNKAGLNFSFQSMKDRGQDNGDEERLSDLEMYHAPGGSLRTLAVRARFEKGRRMSERAPRFQVLGLWGFVKPFGWLWSTSDPRLFVNLPATAPDQSVREEVRITDTAAFLAAFGPLRSIDSLRTDVQAAVKARDVCLPGADLAAEMLHQRGDDPDYAAFAALPDFGGMDLTVPDEKSDRAAVLAYLRRRVSVELRTNAYLKAGLPVPDRLKAARKMKETLKLVAWGLEHQRGFLRSGHELRNLDTGLATAQGVAILPQEVESYLARTDRALAAPTDLKARYGAYQAALAAPAVECATAADAVIALLQDEEAQARREERIATAVWIQKEIGRLNCGGRLENPDWRERDSLVGAFHSWPWRQPVAINLPRFVGVTGAGVALFFPNGLSRRLEEGVGEPLSLVEVKVVENQAGPPVLSAVENIVETNQSLVRRPDMTAWRKWKAQYDEAAAKNREAVTIGDPLAGVLVGPSTTVYSDRARVSAEAARSMREGHARAVERAKVEAQNNAEQFDRLKRQEPPQYVEEVVTTERKVGRQRYRVPVKLRAELVIEGQSQVCERTRDFDGEEVVWGVHGPGASLITAEQARQKALEDAVRQLQIDCVHPAVNEIARKVEAKWRAAGGEGRLVEAKLLPRRRDLAALGPRGALEEQARPLADDYADKVNRGVMRADAPTPLDDLFRKAWELPAPR